MNNWRVITGDVRDGLAGLPAGSVRTCVTSPPYWGLRDYGVSGQLGLEATPEAYCEAMVGVFAEVRRVLADDGTVWLNLGDSYAGGGNNRGNGSPLSEKQASSRGAIGQCAEHAKNIRAIDGVKTKDLVGIPWMVAFALRADGWYLRSDIIWSKPNPMPESVTDRPTKAHEYIFLLSKSKSYYYDSAAIREPGRPPELWHGTENNRRSFRGGEGAYVNQSGPQSNHAKSDKQRGHGRRHAGFNDRWDDMERAEQLQNGANKRSVWHVATQPYPDAHFATFPETLIEPCILAGSAHGDTVLDPFTGSGTTGAVAIRHQRNFIGCELNPAYVELARKRIGSVAPMFAEEVA